MTLSSRRADLAAVAGRAKEEQHAMAEPLVIAKNPQHRLALLPAMGNRHGLITGATGTGKTVTLQVIAQAYADIGVPDIVLGSIFGNGNRRR